MGEMGCRMSRDIRILPSMCDSSTHLSIPAVLDIFQDNATLHADHFDIGPEGMERRNYFWVITKTRLHINRLPVMMDEVSVNTWIQAPERASCERDYSISCGEEVLAYGRSIWAVISRDTGKLVHMSGLYPELDFNKPAPDDRPFLRLGRKFDDAKQAGQYTVRSGDIDLGGHMNNVNYIRAMLGCFTTDEIRAMGIEEIEMNFLSQSFEGETLTFMKRVSDGHLEVGALSPDGKNVFAASISGSGI